MLVLHTSLTNCSFSQCPAKSNRANFEELKLTETLGQTMSCRNVSRSGGDLGFLDRTPLAAVSCFAPWLDAIRRGGLTDQASVLWRGRRPPITNRNSARWPNRAGEFPARIQSCDGPTKLSAAQATRD